MPRRAKRKGSNNATPPKGEQQTKLVQLIPQQESRGPKQPDVEYAFPKMFLKPSQSCFFRENGNGRQNGGLESPYSKTIGKPAKGTIKGGIKPATSKSTHNTSLRSIKSPPPRELLNKTASSFDGWMLQKSKTSASKIRSEPVKPTVSPLARNRFYELRDKTPVREKKVKKQPVKESNGQQKRAVERVWMPKQQSDMQVQKAPKPGSPGITVNKCPSHQFGSWYNNDGNRGNNGNHGNHHGNRGNWKPIQISNWRDHGNPKPHFPKVGTLRFPDPPPCRNENLQSKHKLDEMPQRNRRPIMNPNEKIAPLHNLASNVRDLWVSKPEHANYGQFRCVRILPAHHQCAGLERNLTPNDVDTKTLAIKLEKHSRLPRPGSKSAQCICFRKTRRAYCTVCKATIIGRAFRKCRVHPEVGFLTDHFYCPFCRADPSALRDI